MGQDLHQKFPGILVLVMMTLLFAACGGKNNSSNSTDPSSATGPTAEETANIDAARKFMDAFNSNDTAVIRAMTDASYIEHQPAPGQRPGIDGLIEACMNIKTGFPDMHVNIEEIVAHGDRIAVRSKMTGTFSGEFAGMKPNGKKMTVEAIDIMRMKDGRQAEHWGQFDMMGMMQQLGMMPPDDPANTSAGAPSSTTTTP